MTQEETIRRAMRALAKRRHAASTPEQRSEAARQAAQARHAASTPAERKALGQQLAAARLKKRAKGRKSKNGR